MAPTARLGTPGLQPSGTGGTIMGPIYLDNNATTPLLPAVWEAMRPFLTEVHGNPASAHAFGRRARRALEDAREQTAALLDAHPDEVIFTSGATEANNLALFGLAGDPPGHLLASPIEHPSVLEPLRHLAAHGFTLDFLPVDAHGVVIADALPELLRPDTRLVSVMLANHETGAVQPVAALATTGFHCDAVQAVGKLPVSFHNLGVTTLALSAHKFHGPKGVGALLLRRGVKLQPRTWGGHQQHGHRPGTEPVALAVGLATALQHACAEMGQRQAHVRRLRERFLGPLRAGAAPMVLNGPEVGPASRAGPEAGAARLAAPTVGPASRAGPEAGAARLAAPTDEGLPHTLNVSFPGLKADLLLMSLDLAGVACSTGSACSSGSLLPSPVLQAMGVPEDVLHSAMRFSLSPLLSEAEVEEAARRVIAVVNRLRQD